VVCWRSFGLEVVSRLALETSVRVPWRKAFLMSRWCIGQPRVNTIWMMMGFMMGLKVSS
jgi:hypothetical protein